MNMRNAQEKRFIDKKIYQKSTYGNDVLSETCLPSPIPKHAEITHPASPQLRTSIMNPLKLKDRGQGLTGTISWTNLRLKKQIHEFMFHSINIGSSTFISAGRKSDPLPILRKMKFPEMVVRSKKGKLTSNRSLPESLPPTEVSASQHSLRVYLQITYWKITRYNKKFD